MILANLFHQDPTVCFVENGLKGAGIEAGTDWEAVARM